jgi:hypothetical protein
LGVLVMMRKSPRLSNGRGSIRRFAAACDARELRMLRIRIKDRGPITAFRWRGVPGEYAAPARPRGVAEKAGIGVQRGRKVLELQPPGFLAGGVEGFARVVEGLLRVVR